MSVFVPLWPWVMFTVLSIGGISTASTQATARITVQSGASQDSLRERAIVNPLANGDVLVSNTAVGDAGPSRIARAFLPSISAQVDVITVDYGLFEGLSTAIGMQQIYGAGYTGAALVHIDYSCAVRCQSAKTVPESE